MINGEQIRPGYTRVSNVLSPFTGIEFVPEEPLKNAAHRGTLVHSYIEADLGGYVWEVIPPEIKPYWDAFEEVCYRYTVRSTKDKDIERRFYDDKLMITGQADLVLYWPHKTVIFDWKTSYAPSISWPLQAQAYIHLARVNSVDVAEARFFHLQRDGTFDQYVYEYDPEQYGIFLKCLDLYRYFKMDKTRKKKE